MTHYNVIQAEKHELLGEYDQKVSEVIHRYRNAVNYLAAAQIYLKDNPLLKEPLKPEHIKQRLLGHWGTAPGINLIYAHLNRLILRTDANILLITGPGHGAAANLANMYIEGSLTKYFPELTQDEQGLKKFLKWFSWPNKFASHLNPQYPGVIHEGGELGYALSTAYGAALDNPDLVVPCIVGDGEAESGPTAGAWHSGKFVNPVHDGAVLPILHLNGFKISNPTIYSTMSNDELTQYFQGNGYQVGIVEYSENLDSDFDSTLWWAYRQIRDIQNNARSGNQPEKIYWPMIILKTPKGMSCPKEVDGKNIEGSFRSHQVPVKDARDNPEHLDILQKWLKSYKPEELFDENGTIDPDIKALCPEPDKQIALNKQSFGGFIRKPLELPDIHDFAVGVEKPGAMLLSGQKVLAKYLRKVIAMNQHNRNFRIVCPDELQSNRLGAVLDVTDRQYNWPLPENTEHTSKDGRVLEVLNEHNCHGWLQGYLLTGRHGIFSCYEAFLPIIHGMMNQYVKFLKAHLEVEWRESISSMNYLLSSETWRQDHNGYSHQGPGFINNLLTKKGHTYRIYFPPDANCVVSTVDHCLKSTDDVNLILAGKQPMPQWLNMEQAIDHCRAGASIWSWASTNQGEDPQIILCGCGDSVTLEVMAAAKILRQEAPDLRVRVVNVSRLTTLGIPEKYPPGLDEMHFQRIFPIDVPVIFNFHGYTAAIKQLVWERPGSRRFDINGYREEGTTTTPFDMHIKNRTSRYHLIIQTAQKIAAHCPDKAAKCEDLIRRYKHRIREHQHYILDHGVDLPEITNWDWSFE